MSVARRLLPFRSASSVGSNAPLDIISGTTRSLAIQAVHILAPIGTRLASRSPRLVASVPLIRPMSTNEPSQLGGDRDPMNGSPAGQERQEPQGSPPSTSVVMRSSPIADAALTSLAGIVIVFAGGIAYFAWYKQNVLDKIELAFAGGYDPALELASLNLVKDESDPDRPTTLRRTEQDLIDRVVQGVEVGQYYMIMGPKGTGKTSMIFEAMHAVQAEGVAMCDAHPDIEVFRLRLGKALNFEFYEDTQTGLFQRRDPREGGAALDIERAMNKLEKVALRYSRRKGRPLALILNNIQYFHNTEEGRNMLLQLQQRAESWAASGILTMIFATDDSWPVFLMRKNASRMRILSIYDLDTSDAVRALATMRHKREPTAEDRSTLAEAVSLVGGRLSYLARVAAAPDTAAQARYMLAVERAWLLSQIGLIPDCDDDVMDEQKWSTCSWLLLREFVKQRRADEARRDELLRAGAPLAEDVGDLSLPKIAYYKCRQIMTRPDFLEDLDRANIIAIDANHDVMPDSLLLLHAAAEVVEEEGFDDLLDSVRNRVDEIESLHRTRELIFKPTDDSEHVRITVRKAK